MVAHFHINETIDDNLLDKFMNFANNHPDQPWKIKLNTGGGAMSCETYIRHTILNHPHQVTIVVWSAFSVGFKLIYKLKDKAQILFCNGCAGMFHYGTRKLDMDDRAKITFHNDEFLKLKVLPHIKKEHDLIAENTLTQKQLKQFKQGKDVYIEQDQLLTIFPKAKLI